MLNSEMQVTDFISLKDREFYEYYKKNRKATATAIYQYNDFEKTVGSLMASLKTLLLEREGGVYIEKLGYFAVFKTPKKTRKRNTFATNLLSFLPQYRWYPVFFGDIDSNTLKHWTMSKAFMPKLNNQVKERISKGKKYKLYYSVLKTIASASRATRSLKK